MRSEHGITSSTLCRCQRVLSGRGCFAFIYERVPCTGWVRSTRKELRAPKLIHRDIPVFEQETQQDLLAGAEATVRLCHHQHRRQHHALKLRVIDVRGKPLESCWVEKIEALLLGFQHDIAAKVEQHLAESGRVDAKRIINAALVEPFKPRSCKRPSATTTIATSRARACGLLRRYTRIDSSRSHGQRHCPTAAFRLSSYRHRASPAESQRAPAPP